MILKFPVSSRLMRKRKYDDFYHVLFSKFSEDDDYDEDMKEKEKGEKEERFPGFDVFQRKNV